MNQGTCIRRAEPQGRCLRRGACWHPLRLCHRLHARNALADQVAADSAVGV